MVLAIVCGDYVQLSAMQKRLLEDSYCSFTAIPYATDLHFGRPQRPENT
jgi:hypothetical protein